LKILIAEDDPSFRRLLEEILEKWGYEVLSAADGEKALHLLRGRDAPRMAVMDWKMPGMDGTEVCRRIREEIKEPYTYIIILTSQQRDEDLVAGMEAGADDYLTKPFKHIELRLRLRAGRRIIELQNELLASREFLRVKASHDSLTGLWNHEEILGILTRELARSGRDGNYVSVIMADLDHFKKINDTYGHMAGDVVLLTAAGRMQSLMRRYDSIGRYGGEEFLVVLPDCCPDCASAFAERLRASIGGKEMDTPEGMISLTVSLGVAVSGKGRNLEAGTLLRAADKALYRAKAKGRNRVEIYAGKLRIVGIDL